MALPKQLNQIQQDEKKLNREQAKIQAMLQILIKEQRAIIKKADEQIDKASRELRALQHRLKPYLDGKLKFDTDAYRSLKERYEYWLRERSQQHAVINIAEESIGEAQMAVLPEQNADPMVGV